MILSREARFYVLQLPYIRAIASVASAFFCLGMSNSAR